LWNSAEEIALKIGESLEEFWTESPKQFEKRVKVYKELEKKRVMENDINNYNLGRYLIYAFNDPKKYPKKPVLQERDDDNKSMSGLEMERKAELINKKLGGNNDRN